MEDENKENAIARLSRLGESYDKSKLLVTKMSIGMLEVRLSDVVLSRDANNSGNPADDEIIISVRDVS